MKIEQKIAAGGINKTSTPMLKLRMKRLLVALVNAVRHIEHCASAYEFASSTKPTAAMIKPKTRHQLDLIYGSSSAAGATAGCSLNW